MRIFNELSVFTTYILWNTLAELNQPTLQRNRKLKTTKNAKQVIYKSFANHESIKAIKENNIEKSLTAANSHLPKVSVRDLEQLLRNIDT